MFCNFIFRETNLKRDKNGTKPQENKVKNTFDRQAPLGSINLSSAKVRICPNIDTRNSLFLSFTIAFLKSYTTKDNTNDFYPPI